MNGNFPRFKHTAGGMEQDEEGNWVLWSDVKTGIGQQLSILATILQKRQMEVMQITLADLNAVAGKNIEFSQGLLNGEQAVTLHLVDAEPQVEDGTPGYK